MAVNQGCREKRVFFMGVYRPSSLLMREDGSSALDKGMKRKRKGVRDGGRRGAQRRLDEEAEWRGGGKGRDGGQVKKRGRRGKRLKWSGISRGTGMDEKALRKRGRKEGREAYQTLGRCPLGV